MNESVSHERLLYLLDFDRETGVFKWKVKNARSKYPAGSKAGCLKSLGYVCIKIDGLEYKAHRLSWFYVNGKWPDGDIDHINRVKSDNSIKNLRVVTDLENMQNRGAMKNSKSGVKGVHFCAKTKKWVAQIAFNRRRYRLGSFDGLDAAVKAYSASAKELHSINPFAS